MGGIVLTEPRDRTITMAWARFRDLPADALGCISGVDPLLWKNLRGERVKIIKESFSTAPPEFHIPGGWCEGPWWTVAWGEWERFHELPSRGAQVVICQHMLEFERD